MKRILKLTGSFVLNIKEKAVDGEQHTYVLELILTLKRETGFRWEKNASDTKPRLHPANGNIVLETLGNAFFISVKLKALKCIKTL